MPSAKAAEAAAARTARLKIARRFFMVLISKERLAISRNPNLEFRNPKQIPNPNHPNTNCGADWLPIAAHGLGIFAF
jgi:hypothetical protein